jgi:hypothetical protein
MKSGLIKFFKHRDISKSTKRELVKKISFTEVKPTFGKGAKLKQVNKK